MLQEERTDILLKAVYKNGNLNLYDFCSTEWPNDEVVFMESKAMADELVDEKLARYNDVQRTELSITNFGRYWIAHGGFLIYLKEGEKKIKSQRHYDEQKEKHHEELKEELKEARLKFTHYRIVTYWWGFAVSIISFLLSLLSLYLILSKK